jgi:subtilisin family serine protease
MNTQHFTFSVENTFMIVGRNRFLICLILLSNLALLTGFKAEASVIVDLKPSPGSPSVASQSLSSLPSIDTPKNWKYLPHVDLYLVESEQDETLQKLRSQGVIHRSSSDHDIVIEKIPDDPMIESIDWITPADSPFDLGLSEAWDLTTGEASITVAIIDTGIDIKHPDLAGNLWTNPSEIDGNGVDDDDDGFIDDIHGYNFWSESGSIQDDNGHGSHIAGVIGAQGNNENGISGINWNVRLMALKFTDAEGAGSTVKAIEAIDYAIGHGARIINASWTIRMDEQQFDAAALLKKAIRKADQAGLLFVDASGNQFRTGEGLNIDVTPVYPAAFQLPNMITVGSLERLGGMAPYSKYGAEAVDLVAPGDGILSTLPDGKYGYMSGTSIATAFVSGAAALLLSLHPDLSPEDIKSTLISAVTERDTLSGLVASSGSLHVGRAISVPAPTNPTPATTNIGGISPDIGTFQPASGGCTLIQ